MSVLPPYLKAGEPIALIGPSFLAKPEEKEAALRFFRQQDYRLDTFPDASGNSWGKFTGTDTERLAELQWALDHPEARVILCLRGGYGLGRILEKADWSSFRKNPKWLVGFSDISLLHQHLNQLGFASVQGPMLVHFARNTQQEACALELELLEGKRAELRYPTQAIRPGQASGILYGGNLSMLAHSCGKFPAGSYRNGILMLEEIGEHYYRIDRMLWQLAHSGLLDGIKAVVMGQFTDCQADGFPLRIEEMILEKLPPDVPLFAGLAHGHDSPCFPIVTGWPARLGQDGTFSQSFPTNPA